MKLEIKVWDNEGVPKIMMEDPDVDSTDLRELYNFLKKKLKRETGKELLK